MDDSVKGASLKHYYYTDPLAAAWMAKHFVMDVRIGSPEGDRFLDAVTTRGVDTFGGAIAANNHTRFYIHPDSLHLLEPQLGDIVTINDPTIDYHGYCFKPDVLYRTYADGSYGTDELPCTPPECRSRDVRIIQRHRGGLIAFHWPECEAI